MLKTLGRRALHPFLGRKRWQRAFQSLYEISLAGLNIGEGNHPAASGERFVMELIAQRVRDHDAVIFDVGANTGAYASELLQVLPPTARILAFEPSPASFRLLRSRLGESGSVELKNLGFSDVERAATLYSAGEGSKLASVHDIRDRLARVGLSGGTEEAVQLTTLDTFCANEGIDRIDFLKLDVEGHELKALHGANRLLENRSIDAIQFEFSAANVDSRTFFKDFFDLLHETYRISRVLQDGLQPIDGYVESVEIFKRATNYLALLRTTDEFE